MSDPNFHELLGDDGEFKDPVNARYGVYSPKQRGHWRVPVLMLSLCACAVIALIWYG
ncbi:MAG: hypothetical protein ACFE0Q_09045 [Anaerolineae bacterium]